jgi:CheY-like chemotaxis protein
MLIECLEDVGFVAVGADNGLDAWNQLQQGLRPCLILLDLMMPYMNGLQFRTLQQTDPKLARIPVVILTAVRNPVEAAEHLQVQHWLSKPLDTEQVILIVRAYCNPR